MKDYVLPKRTLLLWQLRTVAIAIIALGVCGYFYFKFRPLLILLIFLSLFFLSVIFWYLPSYFKCCKLRLTKDGVILRKGVLIKNTHILPFSRLIYTQTVTTPLAKLLGLKAVTLKAARSRLLVPELHDEDIDRLLAALIKGDGL